MGLLPPLLLQVARPKTIIPLNFGPCIRTTDQLPLLLLPLPLPVPPILPAATAQCDAAAGQKQVFFNKIWAAAHHCQTGMVAQVTLGYFAPGILLPLLLVLLLLLVLHSQICRTGPAYRPTVQRCVLGR
jgi:hypothetical protein